MREYPVRRQVAAGAGRRTVSLTVLLLAAAVSVGPNLTTARAQPPGPELFAKEPQTPLELWGAVDYLIKPVSPARLATAIARVKERMKVLPARLDELLKALAEPTRQARQYLRWISVAQGRTVRLITIEDLVELPAMTDPVSRCQTSSSLGVGRVIWSKPTPPR